MGATLCALGKAEEGRRFQQALTLNPDDVEGVDIYGLALLKALDAQSRTNFS
jgi:hypothetical protein